MSVSKSLQHLSTQYLKNIYETTKKNLAIARERVALLEKEIYFYEEELKKRGEHVGDS